MTRVRLAGAGGGDFELAHGTLRYSSRCKNYYFAEISSGSKAGSHRKRMDFVYYTTLGSRVIKKKKKFNAFSAGRRGRGKSRTTARHMYIHTHTRTNVYIYMNIYIYI